LRDWIVFVSDSSHELLCVVAQAMPVYRAALIGCRPCPSVLVERYSDAAMGRQQQCL